MRKLLLGLVFVASLLVAGCSGGETATTPPETSGTKVVAEMGTCEACKGQFPKAELAMHDGKMTCKKCIEAHGH